MELIAVEGISGAGKSVFCSLLSTKISEKHSRCQLKNFMGCGHLDPIMNRLIFENKHSQIPPHIIQIVELYLFIERELSKEWFTQDIILIQRYIANLYALLRCNGIDVEQLSIFDKYPARITFFLECDPAVAFESVDKRRVISYWEIGKFLKKPTPEAIRKDLIDYIRGVYSRNEIQECFIQYQTVFRKNLLTYLRDNDFITVPKQLSMDEKVDFALEHLTEVGVII